MNKIKGNQQDNCQNSGQRDNEKIIGNRFITLLFDLIPGSDGKE